MMVSRREKKFVDVEDGDEVFQNLVDGFIFSFSIFAKGSR